MSQAKIKQVVFTTGILLFGCQAENEKSAPLINYDKQVVSTVELNTKFLPPNNKKILFIGQDSDTISNYIIDNPMDNIEGITLYTSLKSENPVLALPAIKSSADWNSGTVDFHKSLTESSNAVLAIGLSFDSCNSEDHSSLISHGSYDESIYFLADYLKSIAPRKVFLRIGYEFDGPWNCYQPESYKASFKRIVDILREKNVSNFTSVWQSATWPDPSIAGEKASLYDFSRPEHLSDWYPGDDYVDWVSLSVFYRDLSQWNYIPPYTPDFAQQKILDFARQKNKAVMIAESAPQGYRTSALTHSFIQVNKQSPITAEMLWQAWYEPFFTFINENQDVIRAVAYINTHWESQGMWFCADKSGPPASDCPNGNWGDSRVQANTYIKQQWLKEVNNADRWIQSSQY